VAEKPTDSVLSRSQCDRTALLVDDWITQMLNLVDDYLMIVGG
jgi:hypothetical protein